MIKCPVCKREFVCLSAPHLKTHGYKSISDFKTEYPIQELGDCKGDKRTTPVRKGLYDTGGRREETELLVFYDGEKDVGWRVPKSAFKWFQKFRDSEGWTTKIALQALLTLWDENNESEIVNSIRSRINGGEQLAEIVKNPIKYHNEELEKALRLLEDKIKHEMNPVRLAQAVKNLAEIQKIQIELEKSYKTQSDDRIEQLVKNRKLICKNYLPSLIEYGEKYSEEE